MPLQEGKSDAARSANIAELIKSGRPRSRAVAIAYSKQRDAKDSSPRPAAGVMFVTADGSVLLMRRKGSDHAGEWSIPAGRAEGDETPLQTAEREAHEETGRKPNGKMRHVHSTSAGAEFHTFMEPSDQFQATVTDEHDGAGWFPMNALPEPLHPGLRETLGRDMDPNEWESFRASMNKWLDEETEEAEHRDAQAFDATFEEGKHPRGQGGKWASHAKHAERHKNLAEVHKAQMEHHNKLGNTAEYSSNREAHFGHVEAAEAHERADKTKADEHVERARYLTQHADRLTAHAQRNKTASLASDAEACACHARDPKTGECLSEPVAMDRASARAYDKDGHLRVKRTALSRAAVNEYYGREIPDSERYGLDPNKKYKLLRDPEELKKAAASFNGKPLLIQHQPVNAEDHARELTVGAIGSDVEYEHPFLYGSLSVWDGDAIKAIEGGSLPAISAAYHYTYDPSPGTFEGESYSGIMRGISANHCALVSQSRAGPSMIVQDEKPPYHYDFGAFAMDKATAKYDFSRFALDGKFEESKHPRANNGQFGAGEGKSHAEHAVHHEEKTREHLAAAHENAKKKGHPEVTRAHIGAAQGHVDAQYAHSSVPHGGSTPGNAHELSRKARESTYEAQRSEDNAKLKAEREASEKTKGGKKADLSREDWEDKVHEHIAKHGDMTHGDAQSVAEGQSFTAAQHWGKGSDPETTAKAILAAATPKKK